jgi:ABC-type Mn2+/Zn2+ transport system permease subunit
MRVVVRWWSYTESVVVAIVVGASVGSVGVILPRFVV